MKKDLGIELNRTEGITIVKDGQLPKEIANCSLDNYEKEETVEFTLSLTELHLSTVRGLCAAASGTAYEVRLNNSVIARFPSRKDDCFPRLNPLNIDRMEYSWGRVGLCRVPDINILSLNGRFEGELCLYGKPEVITNNQEVMKKFEKNLFDYLALGEAKRELHLYKKQKSPADNEGIKQGHQKKLAKFDTREKELLEEINRLREELEETKSKPFWKRVLNKN